MSNSCHGPVVYSRAEASTGWMTGELNRWLLTVMDQGIVSGTRFLVTILVGRLAGPKELGEYTIAFSALVLWGCLQEGLVTTPYAVTCHRLGRASRANYASALLILHLFVALVGALSVVLLAALSMFGWTDSAWTRLIFYLAIALPGSLMWEFARRSQLAELKIERAVRLDAATCVLQLLGLAGLAAVGRLDAASSLIAVGGGCLLIAAPTLYANRSKLIVSPRLLGLYARRNWRLGRWLVAGQIVGAIHGLLPSLILAALATAAAAGVFAAYLNLALLTNPLLLVIGTLLTPRAAQAWSRSGLNAVRKLILQTTLAAVTGLFLFVVGLFLFGDLLMGSLYGSEFTGHGVLLLVLGSCPVIWSISACFGSGLAALKCPRGGFIATLLGTVTSGVAIALLVPYSYVTGAALGLLIGGVVGAIAHILIFVAHCRSLEHSMHRVTSRPQLDLQAQLMPGGSVY